MKNEELNEYLDFAKAVAQEAGEIMRKYFISEVQHYFKEDKTIVTIADEKINQLVINRVQETYPEHSVLGEEASSDKQHQYAWICDPIDGTNPYSKGIPVSTFSLALTKDGEPILGVILDPFTDSLYWAAKGQGAFVNKDKISVSSKNLEQHAIINVDWWAQADVDTWLAMHDLALTTSAYTLSIGSVARASSLVASGKFEAAVFPGTKAKFMDIAAAKVIVEEAGGKVTDLFGQEQRYDQDIKGAIISNGICHQQIIDAIQKVL